MYPGGGIIVKRFSKHDDGGVKVAVSGITDVGWLIVDVFSAWAVVCRAIKCSAIMRPLLRFRFSMVGFRFLCACDGWSVSGRSESIDRRRYKSGRYRVRS